MKWLITLETEDDMIAVCRLMNTFRRKGVTISTLALAARPEAFSVMAVVESPEADVQHLFHFLRRTEGVRHVSAYRHAPPADASYVLIDADPHSASVARILETFPKSKLIFASHGKYLLEVPAEGQAQVLADSADADILTLARVMSSQGVGRAELVSAATF